MWKLLLVALSVCLTKAAKLDEVFAWNELSFAWPSDEIREKALNSGDYVPANNLPLGLDRWKDKLFVTVPRWKAGVAASLGYLPLSSANKTASVIPYPDWKANTLPHGDEKPEDNHIISTFRVKVDQCDRLWVMDTGLADILGEPKQISPPAIVVFDLKTDKLLRRYTLQPTDLKEDSFFANIVVDVDPAECDKAFAYIPDLGEYGLVVYSWADNDSWRVKHNFFYFDPLKGDFNVGGVNFQWTDGVFGLALGPRQQDGYRTLYFHPLASTREFSVNTHVLQNKTVATDPHSYYLFKIEGNRGDLTQASASDFDEKANVLFLTQLNRDGVACWNPKKTLNSQSLALVAQDKEALIFTNDIKVDPERNLWILSDKMPIFIYKQLDASQVNYRIFKAKVDDLIKDTVCSV
ncbi:yellow-c [Asbolus verrucosus]|uniref:Protein yellow n=1 Tax=Asbolus verrucosus TaxID=1661398 RepID=A0A482VLC2_ASBVE|nr:yellow-c [Asbolus verrucosus]